MSEDAHLFEGDELALERRLSSELSRESVTRIVASPG